MSDTHFIYHRFKDLYEAADHGDHDSIERLRIVAVEVVKVVEPHIVMDLSRIILSGLKLKEDKRQSDSN